MFTEDLLCDDVSIVTLGDLSEKEYLGAKPLTIFEDNQACIHLSRNPVSHRSTKHIEVRYHFVRERTADGTIKLVKVDTKENPSDILTKSTRKGVFIYHRDRILHPNQPKVTGIGGK